MHINNNNVETATAEREYSFFVNQTKQQYKQDVLSMALGQSKSLTGGQAK